MRLTTVLSVLGVALLSLPAQVAAADAGAEQKRAEEIVAERLSLIHI